MRDKSVVMSDAFCFLSLFCTIQVPFSTVRLVALVVLQMHPLKHNIPPGHQDFAVQYQFRRTCQSTKSPTPYQPTPAGPMSHTHFLPPSPLLSLHSISTYPRRLLPTGGSRSPRRPLPSPPPPAAAGGACAAGEPCLRPPPHAFPVPCSLPTPAALHVPCSLPTPVAELRPTQPCGARPPSNRWRVRRIQDWIDTVAARFSTPAPHGAPPSHRPAAAGARAGGGASFCGARWREILLKGGGRRPHRRRAAARAWADPDGGGDSSLFLRQRPPSVSLRALLAVDIVDTIFLSLCCPGFHSLLSAMARTATTGRQVGPDGA
jgi:hypothetical protein